jgi:hypothetical protein
VLEKSRTNRGPLLESTSTHRLYILSYAHNAMLSAPTASRSGAMHP